jgi:hypothetical protein
MAIGETGESLPLHFRAGVSFVLAPLSGRKRSRPATDQTLDPR